VIDDRLAEQIVRVVGEAGILNPGVLLPPLPDGGGDG
jgi:hypothetical protein